ncbi:RusA family crossover junction endodeoxyribonuclease [Sinorhizobium chiapasense]|uniref:Uncharacterized protein n=1 Tax=Sinorhizobium chiapasense TaxID=501572 RepID=A0ABZ2BEV9_9HYPH
MIVWSEPNYALDWRVAWVGTVRIGYINPPSPGGNMWQWHTWIASGGFSGRGLALDEDSAKWAVTDAWQRFMEAAGLQPVRRDDRPWLRFRLPLPPSIWDMYTGWGENRRKSKVYKRWVTDAGWFVKPPAVPITKPFDIVIAMERPHGLMDVDNRLKPFLDCLQHYKVIKNDNRCESAAIRWQADLGHECIAEVRECLEGVAA